jgi:hypothetical protein
MGIPILNSDLEEALLYQAMRTFGHYVAEKYFQSVCPNFKNQLFRRLKSSVNGLLRKATSPPMSRNDPIQVAPKLDG